MLKNIYCTIAVRLKSLKMKKMIISVVLFFGILFTFPRFITADLKHVNDDNWQKLLDGEWIVML